MNNYIRLLTTSRFIMNSKSPKFTERIPNYVHIEQRVLVIQSVLCLLLKNSRIYGFQLTELRICSKPIDLSNPLYIDT